MVIRLGWSWKISYSPNDCRTLLTNEKLGAAFFFFRGDPQRNDANRLFPTLAWQLMSYVPEIKEHVSAIVEMDPFLPTRSIQTQFEQLIVKPFQLAADNNSLLRTSGIVVIDGVDECAGETIQQCFLSLLGSAVDNGGLPLRFLICSRPEPHIRETFDQSISVRVASRIVLNDDLDSYNDIRRYLLHEFVRISTERGIASDTWPPEGELHRLVQNSSGQFIYATTVIKFVGDKYAHPKKQLEIISGIRRRSDGSSPFADLDQLYLEILARQPDQNFLKAFLNLFYLYMNDRLGFERYLVDFINAMSDLEEGELFAKLRGLHSLLEISESDKFIRVYHASFFEFLLDPTRSHQYYLDMPTASRTFIRRFSTVYVKYVSKIQQTRCVLSMGEIDS